MPKYHISPKTSKPNICRANTKPCPLGDAPHFDSKDEAEAFVQGNLQAVYSSFKTSNKKSEAFISALFDAEPEVGSSGYAYDAASYVQSLVPDTDIEFKRSIEEPDYYETVLFETGGQQYSARVHGDTWDNRYALMHVSKVDEIVVKQEKSKVHKVDKLDNFGPILKQLKKDSRGRSFTYPAEEEGVEVLDASFMLDADYDNEDGSKTIVRNLLAPGDRKLSDEPNPIEVPLDFEENGQRQNSRQMDEGLLIYNTGLKRGVVMKWRGGSELQDQTTKYHWDGKTLSPTTESSKWYSYAAPDLYEIEGTGELQDASYYKES